MPPPSPGPPPLLQLVVNVTLGLLIAMVVLVVLSGLGHIGPTGRRPNHEPMAAAPDQPTSSSVVAANRVSPPDAATAPTAICLARYVDVVMPSDNQSEMEVRVVLDRTAAAFMGSAWGRWFCNNRPTPPVVREEQLRKKPVVHEARIDLQALMPVVAVEIECQQLGSPVIPAGTTIRLVETNKTIALERRFGSWQGTLRFSVGA